MSVFDFQVSKNFMASELLPPEAFDLSPQEQFRLITPFLRIVPQRFRDLIGKSITMNDWNRGGQNKYRGWRPMNCKVGAKFSAHKFGMAIDIIIPGMDQKEIHEFFMQNKDKFPEITRFERLLDTPSWNHYDGLFSGVSQLIEVKG